MMETDAPLPDPRDQRRMVAVRLVDATRSLRTFADHVASGYGTTLAQWKTLKHLVASDGRNQVELAEALEIQPISLVRLLDRMAAQGLVERRPDPADRRAKLIFITEAGRDLSLTMSPIARAIADEITAGLSDDEIDDLLAVLDRININARRALGCRQTVDAAAPRPAPSESAHVV
jgi:MarR family transcriptional regulator, transcriptional regulator for hemolysin